jgi:hypothetical protein
MNDLLDVIANGIIVILSGAEMVLEFMDNTEIFHISLLNWFYGYFILDTIIWFIIGLFEDKTDDIDNSFTSDDLMVLDNGMEVPNELD